jgi:quercetin dioxygenase-like cupin family protein
MTEPTDNALAGRLTIRTTARFSGIEAGILLGGEAAPLTVMQMLVAQEQGAPLHISHEEDKLFRIACGTLLFVIGEDRIEAVAGETVFVPRGTVHGFAAQGGEAEMVLVSTPARHDRFFLAMDALPVPHRMEDVAQVCQRFGQSIVGPVVTG